METSNISWTDGTWNPWYGCDKVSTECKNCYIDRVLEKQGLKPWGQVYEAKGTWGLPDRMQRKAAADHKRYKLFTCSLSDFFHIKADPLRQRAWDTIKRCPDVDFLVLTKRADRIAACLPADWGIGWHNVWLGVSIGVMKSAWRADELRKIPAVVRFISAEPLLESLADLDLSGIHWVIVGGESGENFRPGFLDIWGEELLHKCEASAVTFFFKQDAAYQSGARPNLLGKIYHNWPVPVLEERAKKEAEERRQKEADRRARLEAHRRRLAQEKQKRALLFEVMRRIVSKGKHALAQTEHPDKGGSGMVLVNETAEKLVQLIREAEKEIL